jgi:PAS domain S-box-containing protein
MSDELSTLYASLENQVLERVRALKTSTEISRRLSTILDRQRLIVDVVDEIQQAFDYYHVHIYLFDNERQNLMIAGGTGEAGQAMLDAGHSVPLGRGLVGRSAASKQQMVVQDTTTEPTWLPNPLLPDTRSEVVIPIIVGENILGVLDVQHNIQDGFPNQEIELLQAIANQVAIALQNAEQYAQTQLALRQASEEEARFRAIFEGSNDAIMLLDEKGFFDCNDQTLELFGFQSRDDFLRCTPADVSPSYQPDGAESNTAVQERVQRAFQEGYNRFDWTHKRVNDVEFPAEVLLSAFDLSGRRVLQATVRDLTERKQAQDALAKQVSELARVAEIGALATSVLEPTELLQRVSNLVRDGFGLYHAHIYLISESENVLFLAAGAGEVGLEMVRQGWRIPTNSERSLVAQAARRLEGVIANDVRSELDFLPNPLLPNTASEMAVPLVVGDQLLGVLDVQSEQVEYFTPADVSIQLTLASQIAVALQNARRYSQIRESEQLVRTIIDATPDWIFIKDQEHRYRLVNRGYGNSLHIPPEEFIGKNDLELGFPEELVLGNPEKGIEGFWADDRRVMESGQAQSIPNDLVMIDGMPHIFNTLKIPLKDDTGQAWGVLAFARDITERERLQRETEERLEEVNALYRTLSRESWEQYRQTSRKDYAFIFDRNSVQEAGNQWIEETISAMRNNSIEALPNQPVTVAPLTLRGDVIGALAVQTSPEDPLSEDELLLIREMTEQIALALESARLFVQTQQALGETETLYQIIADMNSAINYDQILGAIQQRTILQDANQLLLAVFNQPINVHSETTPEWLYPVAFRTDSRVKVAQRYPIEAFESKPGVLFTNHAVVIKRVDSDQRLDKVTRTLFKDVFRAHDTIVIPLILGEQIIGFLQAFYEGPTDFLVSEIQRLSAVASQAAIAVQSRLLLEQAQQRARQEARIREVTSQIFSASDVDSIMRRAVEQVGRTLEAKAFVYLNPTG